MSKVIYDDQQEFSDLSDEGLISEKNQNNMEYNIFISKLPKREREIALLLVNGFTMTEIKKICHYGHKKLRLLMDIIYIARLCEMP